MPPRVLLFPSYRGGGFGHVGRCLALAAELAGRGCECAFVLGEPHAGRVAAAGWRVFRPPPAPPSPLRRLGGLMHRFRPRPAYLFFSDLNFQAVRDGFDSPETVQREVAWELEVVRHFRPQVLVGDVWLLTSVVGRLAGLPVVQIVRSAAHPDCPQLVWWRALPDVVRSPGVAHVFNPALKRWGLPPIRRAEDLLDGDLLLVPSIPELDPLPAGLRRTHYVGPLVGPVPVQVQVDGTPPPSWLADPPRGRPLVYVTLGGGSDAPRSLDLLPVWQAAFRGSGWEVVVSLGGQPVPARWRRCRELRVLPWVPGAAVAARADLVLFHGGYGTMMDVVRAGVPSVVLPSHTEQEGNGRRLEQSGAARVLAPDDERMAPLPGGSGPGRFVAWACHKWTITPGQVREAISLVLDAGDCRAHALNLQREQAAYDGSAWAAGQIVRLCQGTVHLGFS